MPGFFSKERITASPGYNRWWGIPAALLINLSIGQAYAFSVFNLPLTRAIGITESAPGDWRLTTLGWVFTLAYVFLGLSAGFAGAWQDRVGPRKSGIVATFCWSGGFYIAALGVYLHQIWMLYLGYGIIGGCGLGIGFNTPISPLIRWFPDHRGMATGAAIMGFGGGAIIAAPLSEWLMGQFSSTSSVGVAETFVVLGTIYFLAMGSGSLLFRLPPPEWQPQGWEAEQDREQRGARDLTVGEAMKTSSFYFMWTVMLLNVTAGIGVLGQASAMVQEVFRGFSGAAAAGFVALLSLFNMGGRFLWAFFSDHIGRKATYAIFFSLGPLLYALVPVCGHMGSVVLFVGCFSIILTMYGGGFACLPAYVADTFGPRHVGAIHGRLLTALSAAGLLGPIIVNYVREYQVARGIPRELAYDRSMLIMAVVLIVGFFFNLAIRPAEESRDHSSLRSDTPFLPTGGGLSRNVSWLVSVATALTAILGVGLLSGHFLQEFDENVGFHREADRIAKVLSLSPGMNVADVRAGTGKWTADMAKRVAPNGQVYATAGPDPPHVVYETIASAGVDNVTVIVRTPGDQSRVPADCCDAALMRAVYHEFDDPMRPRVTSKVYQALRPGGLLAIIDFDEGTPEQLGGHGIARGKVVGEVTSLGFRLEQVIPDWEGNAYCLLFRRPEEPISRPSS